MKSVAFKFSVTLEFSRRHGNLKQKPFDFCIEYKPIMYSSRKLLRIKVTPDLHLTYSKNGGNLGLVLKMKNIACIAFY